jgi:hypothetical protein
MAEAHAIDLRGLAIGIGVIVAGIVIAVVVPHFLPKPGPDRVFPSGHMTASVPGFTTAPQAERSAFEREKQARLASYGFDAQSGEGHIPIERAMQIMADGAKAKAAAR